MANKHLILLGTHGSEIHSVVFDDEEKTLKRGVSTETGKQPSWLIRHPDPQQRDLVYANQWVDSKIRVYRLVDDQGQLELLGEAESGGEGPTHMAILKDASHIVIAHYVSGNVTLLPLSPDGLFAELKPSHSWTPPHAPQKHHRQQSSHVHQIVLFEDEIIVPDLGSNVVWRLKWDGQEIQLKGEIGGFEEGDGPRHCVIHPDGLYIYVLSEISSHLTVHALSTAGPPVKRFSLLPPKDDGAPRPTGASEIVLLPALSAHGPLLLIASNRDSPVSENDTLALFSVSPTQGDLISRKEEGWAKGLGRHLRGVSSDASGRWVVVLGRDAGGVKVFERAGEDGLELKEVGRMEVDNTVAPLWV
ncbi:hypothetical protein L198_04046 [Cryptococcus wingfieldii CBS 7118]|uniref:6-phosphogluconolactonase n=1 Tax=Cryptococcus wingfieldii CBS 7118 TaxID=1295528 RepID=A0A1E3J9E7_9TREE|nr:hypothetical protein L198_04046 [Cryptococcus wingfieldii CBS 7118]ODN97479.1 hypothetical protein L198_04046 [Cryptococcus wingfieldii CBS 7118]